MVLDGTASVISNSTHHRRQIITLPLKVCGFSPLFFRRNTKRCRNNRQQTIPDPRLSFCFTFCLFIFAYGCCSFHSRFTLSLLSYPNQFDKISSFSETAKLILKEDTNPFMVPPRKCRIHIKDKLQKNSTSLLSKKVEEHTD